MTLENFEISNEASVNYLYHSGTKLGVFEPFSHDNLEITDTFTALKPGFFEWQREFKAISPVSGVRLTLDFSVFHRMDYGQIPAVSYNGNLWGPGNEIKGFSRQGKPWTLAYHRVAVCGATYSESADWSVALWAREGFKGSCALMPGESGVTHRLVAPEEETPQVYILRDKFTEAFESRLDLEKGASFTIMAYLMVRPNRQLHFGWSEMLDEAWHQHKYAHQPRHSGENLWHWGIDYAKNGLWSEEGFFKGFCIGMQWSTEQEKWITNQNIYEIGWCGQNASLANALLADYFRNGSRDSLERGLAVLDVWAEYAPLSNGLFRCHFNRILRPAATALEVQDGCNLGAAATYFFEAVRLTKECGVERPGYRQIALAICDFFVRSQFPDGNLGRAWSNTGECVARDGQTGGFLVPPLLEAYQETGEAKYLETARKAFKFYFQNLSENGYTAAGALDTHCIDKESAIPLLKGSLLLYTITGEPQYLEKAEQAAYYLSTWQWHHTVRYDENTALNKLNYDTFGGTSVSTQHHHQDPYGLVYVVDLLKLATLTNNPIWKERAQALWANGMIGVSDGQLEVMGKLRPTGSQDEGFYHTRWGHWPFNTSQWLVAWPTAFRLEVLRSLSDWSDIE
ncbi:MAG: hypothetical protein J0I20_13400 [Chloroflexi bacterium]|nr:hypothetical protein [Chloroflexota bacterium]OJV92858.1 MAG: hypothetical protein BGO39_30350 [Chloroflexi bacterium 54-19]